MKNVLLVFLFVALAGCSGNNENAANKTRLKDEKSQFSRKILDHNSALSNLTLEDSIQIIAREQVALCEAFANKYQDDPNAAVFLEYGAKAAKASKQYEKAIALYNQILQRYVEYDNKPEVLFHKAFILDEDLNRDDEARSAYQELIAKYPSHPLATTASNLMNLLYLSDEELIKRLKK